MQVSMTGFLACCDTAGLWCVGASVGERFLRFHLRLIILSNCAVLALADAPI